MKVRMKTCARGPEFSADPNEVVDVSDKQAKELLEGGFAEPVETENQRHEEEVEEATIQPPERAISRGRGRRRA